MSTSTTTTATLQQKDIYTREELDAAIVNNQYIYTEHFDVNYIRQINEHVFDDINDNYFRPEFIGFDEPIERNNEKHPVILASNHSGMAFPWDAMVFGCGFFKKFNYDTSKAFRVLTAPMLSQTKIMHPYTMLHSWKMAGGIDARFLNFETMMHMPKTWGNLLIYPEGVPGIGKGFNRKYKLQRLATSFVRMALKYKTDIVSFSTVNAEYVAPFMYSSKKVNKWINKLGIPFLPLGPLTLMLLFPFAFYLSFPCKMFFVKGRRFSVYKWFDKPFEEIKDEEVYETCDKLKVLMQEDLDKAVEQYGKAPFKIGEFFKRMLISWKQFPYNTPLGWPFVFLDFEKQWFEGGKDGKPMKIYKGFGAIFRFIWRVPMALFYFVPILGWFPIVFAATLKWKSNKNMSNAHKKNNKNKGLEALNS